MALQAIRSDLLNVCKVFCQSVRTRKLGPKPPKVYDELEENLYPGEYCLESHGMKYYPRDKNYKDPPYEPTKLLMIKRVKQLKGLPWWDIQILKKFGLDGRGLEKVVLVRNMPSTNRHIWKVRHLVQVTPVTCPNGEPTEADINRTFLKPNGELIVSDLAVVHPSRVEGQEKVRNDPLRLDGYTLKYESRRRWMAAW